MAGSHTAADHNQASTAAVLTEPQPQASASSRERDVLLVKVWAPFRTYYSGRATAVSGVNSTGAFDILPRHRNFMTLLNPGDLVLQTGGEEVRIKISGGLMQVHQNAVTVYLDV